MYQRINIFVVPNSTLMQHRITFLFFITSIFSFAQIPPVKPNIVVILADDMGYSDLGCFGSEIHTPNIDSLAQEGVAFPEFYNQSRCCPTRATLLTGRWPHQVGIGEMIDTYARGAREKANSPAYDDHLSINS